MSGGGLVSQFEYVSWTSCVDQFENAGMYVHAVYGKSSTNSKSKERGELGCGPLKLLFLSLIMLIPLIKFQNKSGELFLHGVARSWEYHQRAVWPFKK